MEINPVGHGFRALIDICHLSIWVKITSIFYEQLRTSDTISALEANFKNFPSHVLLHIRDVID